MRAHQRDKGSQCIYAKHVTSALASTHPCSQRPDGQCFIEIIKHAGCSALRKLPRDVVTVPLAAQPRAISEDKIAIDAGFVQQRFQSLAPSHGLRKVCGLPCELCFQSP